ncbi:unnamed protein product, partial [Iphiclides podalirius]
MAINGLVLPPITIIWDDSRPQTSDEEVVFWLNASLLHNAVQPGVRKERNKTDDVSDDLIFRTAAAKGNRSRPVGARVAQRFERSPR